MESITVGKIDKNHSKEMFNIDDSTPMKDGLFFMEDDFFNEVHPHADPPLHPHQYVEPEVIELPKSEAEKLLE